MYVSALEAFGMGLDISTEALIILLYRFELVLIHPTTARVSKRSGAFFLPCAGLILEVVRADVKELWELDLKAAFC